MAIDQPREPSPPGTHGIPWLPIADGWRRAFWKQGYPGLMVTDTAFMRNPHYHRASDTAETLDFERFAKVTEGLLGAVKRLAGPTYFLEDQCAGVHQVRS